MKAWVLDQADYPWGKVSCIFVWYQVRKKPPVEIFTGA